MIILPTLVANGTATLNLSPSSTSVNSIVEFIFSGTFGGGTITLKRRASSSSTAVNFGQAWNDTTSPVTITQPTSGLSLNIPSEGLVDFVLTGATSPSIVITVLGADPKNP